MTSSPKTSMIGLLGLLFLLIVVSGCLIQPGGGKPRMTFFIGVDASGSFQRTGNYDDSLTFLSHYIYGHLNELGGLTKPRALFVGSIGGKKVGEPKTFHPIHDFEEKGIAEIEASLKEWFPPTDTMTDFSSFFKEVGRIARERNLTLTPVSVVLVTDGIPATRRAKAGSKALYEQIDVGPMEYLSRNVTVRMAYASPKVGQKWRQNVPRQRVRLWTVDAEVMKGWERQLKPNLAPADQERFWAWVQDNVDFRVRSRTF